MTIQTFKVGAHLTYGQPIVSTTATGELSHVQYSLDRAPSVLGGRFREDPGYIKLFDNTMPCIASVLKQIHLLWMEIVSLDHLGGTCNCAL